MFLAMQWTMANKLALEASYKYTGADGTCDTAEVKDGVVQELPSTEPVKVTPNS